MYCSPNIVRMREEEKNELGGARSTYGGEESLILGFGGET
jgi:hypothetical protein